MLRKTQKNSEKLRTGHKLPNAGLKNAQKNSEKLRKTQKNSEKLRKRHKLPNAWLKNAQKNSEKLRKNSEKYINYPMRG